MKRTDAKVNSLPSKSLQSLTHMRIFPPRSRAVCSVLLLFASAFPTFASAEDNIVHNFQRQQLTGTYFSEGVSVGDINGDKENDIVYGPYWIEGPSFQNKHEIYAPKPQPMERYADNFFSWIYDFNSDGNNDVFVVGFPGTPAFVYENPGNGSGTWTKHQVFDWVSNESPQFTNLVGDERPELICTRDGFFGFATVNWTKPFEAWTFHSISEKVTATRFGHGLGIGDVDGDGRLDILHAKGWYRQPEKNAGNGRWKETVASFTSAGGGAEMYAYDVDGDGDNDVITSESAHNFGLSWYEQTERGGESQFKRHVIMGQHPSENKYGVLFSELHSVALADIDGDGLKDIVTGKTYWSHHRQSPMWDAGAVAYWFKLTRTSEGVDWIPHKIDGESGIGRQLVVADINADGLLDVATGGMLGANILLHSSDEVSEAEYSQRQPKIYEGPKVRNIDSAAARRGPRSPINSKGIVPDAIEGEALNVAVSGGVAKAQPMGNFSGDHWSGKSQLWWTGAKPGDTLTLELDAFQDVKTIEMALTCARDYGIVEVLLDSKPLGPPIDLFSSEVVTTGLLSFSPENLTKGKHELKFEIVGANAQAVKSYMFGLDFIRFRSPNDAPAVESGSEAPAASDGSNLNLDFESGSLAGWKATGNAFQGQPIQGDTVSTRRQDMSSRHYGEFWIGGYEKAGDEAVGSLTSDAFRVTQRFASFYVGGGNTSATRVELWGVNDDKPFFTTSGRNIEDLSRVIVDLRRVQNGEMFIRLVDESSGGWGHINFDHFRLHAKRPGPLTPPKVQLTADEYPHRGLAAETAANAMKVPEGFEVTVCASEPDVKQPIAMALDDRGRVWIAEAYEYPQRAKGDQGRDRILIFEDTTGDGKLDSRKVFIEGLNLVSGLEVGFGGVWVGAAPYLYFIPDANQDDVPDSDPKVLLDGWGYQDTHETLNAFCWGPDGWLYGCHGVFTHSKVGRPGTPDADRVPLNAGVWRYHPIRHEFEVFAHGTSNPWGVDFNAHGEAFVTACVIPHLFHMIPGARYHRQGGQHFNKYTFDDIKTIADHLHYLGATPHSGNGKSDEAGGGHAHAGAMIYQGGTWPKQFQGALFMNNIHGQRLNVDLLAPHGSGYVGHHGPDFLLTGDLASQILNMRYGPDGQVTFIDWYDMQACHRREVEVHDRSNGRIYKVSYGKQKAVVVNLKTSSDIELAELCLHENDWFVRHSRRILQERAAEREIDVAAIQTLTQIATSHNEDTRRLRAQWALHSIGPLSLEVRRSMIRDESPFVRSWALRLLMEQTENNLEPMQLDRLNQFAAEETSPVVRRSIASALGNLPLDARWEIATSLISHEADADDHNLPLMYWYAIEPLAEVDPDRALALGMQVGDKIPLLREFMLRRVAGTGGTDAIARMVTALGKTQDSKIQLSFLDAIRKALAGQRRAVEPDGWDKTYQELAKSSLPSVAIQASAIGVIFGDPESAQRLRVSLLNTSSSDEVRLDSLAALLAAGDSELPETLLQIIRSSAWKGRSLEAAIRGLAQFEHSAIGPILVERYPSFDSGQRAAAIATLCSRATNATSLLTAIAEEKIPSADLTADLARQLEYLSDSKVTKLLGEAWGQVRKTSAERAELIAQYKQLAANSSLTPANEPLGRAIFAKTCQRCHLLYGVGQKLGPDLTGSNRANIDYLLENIVDPSAVMAKEYRQSIFLTDSGQVVTGIVRAETENAITVQTADATVVLPVAEIEDRKDSDKSMMPDNQLSQFSEHEIRSLIAYLRSSKQSPLQATVDNASGLFNGKDLSGWHGNTEFWSVEAGEIVGKSPGLKRNEFLVSDLSASDFKLSLEIKLVGNQGNSGIQFRSMPEAGGSVKGYQADAGEGWWGKLYEEHGRALLWEKSGEEFLKNGEWNRYEIEAVGSKIRTYLNGQLCVDLDDPDGATNGIFALQLHSGGPMEVRIRNMKLELR